METPDSNRPHQAPPEPASPQTRRRRRWVWAGLAVGTATVILVCFTLIWSTIAITKAIARAQENMPVRLQMEGESLVLTSQSESLWTAIVNIDGTETRLDVPAKQTVKVPMQAGVGAIKIELWQPGGPSPAWTIHYEPPRFKLTPGGPSFGGSISVETNADELLRALRP